MTLQVPKKRNSLLTFSQSSLSSLLESMDFKNAKQQYNQKYNPNTKKKTMKAMKVRFYPSNIQKRYLSVWFGVYRYFYNRAKFKSEETNIYSFQALRNSLRVNGKYEIPNKWKGIKIPPRIITGAIKDYCSAFKTCIALLKNKQIHEFDIKIKRKKGRTQTLNLEKCCFGKGNVLFPSIVKDFGSFIGVYKSRKKKIKIKDLEINHDCRISYQYDKYYLLIPYKKEEVKSNPNYSCISLDSGIRTFQTGFCFDNQHTIEICKNIDKKIFRFTQRIDKLNSYYFNTRENGKFTNKFKKVRKKISNKRKKAYEKIKNKIQDLHWKTIKFLTDNYKHIIISNFKTKKLFESKKLRKITKRSMSFLSHYSFRQKLIEKTPSRGNYLYVVDESYTSKTCGGCGKINQSLGESKIFKCPYCDYVGDRDINASRNIGLKTMFS